MRRILLLLIILLLPLKAVALDIPPSSGYVNDRAGMLSAGTKLNLEHFLENFERSDSTQIVVLTIPSLGGEAVEEYALRVAETWGLGQKGKDNGALLLIAKEERKIRIEVGYGLEGRLTDLLAGRIIDQEIAPRFKDGDIDGGIIAGVAGMAEAVRGEFKGTGYTSRKKKRNPLGILSLLIFLAPWLMIFGGGRNVRRGHRHSGIWFGGPFGGAGGGFGGGGFSGGGGGFGGGGASGSW